MIGCTSNIATHQHPHSTAMWLTVINSPWAIKGTTNGGPLWSMKPWEISILRAPNHSSFSSHQLLRQEIRPFFDASKICQRAIPCSQAQATNKNGQVDACKILILVIKNNFLVVVKKQRNGCEIITWHCVAERFDHEEWSEPLFAGRNGAIILSPYVRDSCCNSTPSQAPMLLSWALESRFECILRAKICNVLVAFSATRAQKYLHYPTHMDGLEKNTPDIWGQKCFEWLDAHIPQLYSVPIPLKLTNFIASFPSPLLIQINFC